MSRRRTSTAVALLGGAIGVWTLLNAYFMAHAGLVGAGGPDKRKELFHWPARDARPHRQHGVESVPQEERYATRAVPIEPQVRDRDNSVNGTEDELAACLLFKDDHAILGEWLAYHYHAARLRHLLVAVDPTSAASPAPLLDVWRRHTDLRVEIWGDADFMTTDGSANGIATVPYGIADGASDADAVQRQIEAHRRRQRVFLSRCLRHMKAAGRGWTMHIDTDEYLVVNPKNRQQALYEVPPPNLTEPGAVLTYLQQLCGNEYLARKANVPCVSLPRLLFGSVEAPAEEGVFVTVPRGYDRARFETLRWRFHARWNDTARNAQPKVLLDLTAVNASDPMFDAERLFSIHRPSYALCRNLQQLSVGSHKRYPLLLNHYLGSRERYLMRRDGRRTPELYDAKACVREGPDDWLASWLEGFLQSVGPRRADVLLRDYMLDQEG